MPYSDESDFKYVDSASDVPITGENIDRNWSTDDKVDAVEAGESKLEADVNEGQVISNPEEIHAEAAATWATYRMVLGMKAPDSTTRGDMLDEGSERMAFADRLRRMYEDIRDSIRSAEYDESAEPAGDEVSFRVFDY